MSKKEADHAIRVLRLKEGNRVELIDGRGGRTVAKLKILGHRVFLEFVETSEQKQLTLEHDADRSVGSWPIVLELAVLKSSAMQWVIEKAVECGVRKMVPLWCERSVVKLTAENTASSFVERWQRIADQALKQCGRSHQLEIALPVMFRDYLSAKNLGGDTEKRLSLWCDEEKRIGHPHLLHILRKKLPEAVGGIKEISLFVGPEGGMSAREKMVLEQTRLPVSLGPTVLRSETAAVYSISVLTAHFCDINSLDWNEGSENGKIEKPKS